ncbi:MAG: MFS transporter [Myxococcales bacterium]|nr:MFS transporter [Myxococcales bacterium]
MLGMMGLQVQSVAVGWQVYEITGDPLQLGYVGLAQFLPQALLSLYAGDVADRFDRKRIFAICYVVLTACTLALAFIASSSSIQVGLIYAALAVVGGVRAFAGPAGQALTPSLVAPKHFANAVAWSSTVWHIAIVLGPALGGVIYALASVQTVYFTAAALEIITAIAIATLPSVRTARVEGGASWQRVSAGMRFVWRHRIVLGALSLDMFAVLLGGAVALLPVYARDILCVGPTGLGLLRSAPAFGATLMALVLAVRPIVRRAGPVMLGCVAVFGAATVVFGISRSFALSFVALTVAGAADMVSVFVRHTLVQLGTPDAMRGRVSAVNLTFIGASNELGEFESGIAAAWLGAVGAVVAGGIGTIAVVLSWAWLFPSLRRVDRLDAEALAPPPSALE